MVQKVRSLAELIAEYRDRTGHSYSDMSARSRSGVLTAQGFQRLATQPPSTFPTPQTLGVLAEVLDLPLATVVLAAAVTVGLPVNADTDAMWLPAGTERLTAEDRAAIRSVTRALVDARGDRQPDVVMTDAAGVTVEVVEVKTQNREDFTLAARHGRSEGRRLRQEQDDAAESQ